MDELWDIAKLSRYLSMKRSTLYAMIERNEIPYYRIGKLARFRPTEIDEWLLTKKSDSEQKESRRVPRKLGLPPRHPKSIVRAVIDDLNPGRYNRSGKPDRIKGLGKEG
jgi:excisionase family DNA binding protein